MKYSTRTRRERDQGDSITVTHGSTADASARGFARSRFTRGGGADVGKPMLGRKKMGRKKNQDKRNHNA